MAEETYTVMSKCKLAFCGLKAMSMPKADGYCQVHYRKFGYFPNKKCTVEGCARKYYAKGFCDTHYTANRVHGDPTHSAKRVREKCTADGCPRKQHAKGLCDQHYSNSRNGIDRGSCLIEGCSWPVVHEGLCEPHYGRKKRFGDPLAGRSYPGVISASKKCTAEGCENKVLANGVCVAHYQRKKKYGNSMEHIPIRKKNPGQIYASVKGTQGYSVMWDATRKKSVAQHRLVMEQIIGRPLTRKETVHHKNGNRGDNRPQNLELWASLGQPAGQTVVDLLAYAREIIRTYEPLERKLMKVQLSLILTDDLKTAEGGTS